MSKLAVFELVNKVTVYRSLGNDDVANEPLGYSREIINCRKFGFTAQIQDVGPKALAKYTLYMLDELNIDDRVYIGETTETNTFNVKAQEVKAVKPLFDEKGVVVGYKVHV